MPEPSDKPHASRPPPPAPAAKPRRRKLRRFFQTLGVLFLILAIFHRPILETVLRLALIKIAASHHVKLDVHFSGSFFTNLEVRDIEAAPNGSGSTPVEKISIQAVRLDYSIPMLIRHGVGELLRSYEIHNADLVFLALPSQSKEEKEQKKSLAEDLNNLLGQPALYSDRVLIDHFNITVRSDTDVTEVKDVQALFDPWKPGYLRIGRIKVPGLPAWENLDATTSYALRDLSVTNLKFSPELVIDEFNFDASQRAEAKGSVSLAAHAFGGTARLSITGTRLNKKGQNLAKSYNTTLKIDVAGVDVHAAGAYFNAKNVPPVTLAWLTTTFAGEPESPQTWKGDLAARAEALDLGKVKVDAAELDSVFHDGHAQVTSGFVELGRNTLRLTGSAALPASINDFSKTSGQAKFQLDAPDLVGTTAALLPGQPISGALTGNGELRLDNGVASANAVISATQVGNQQFGVASAKVNLQSAKPLGASSAGNSLNAALAGLTSHITAEFTGLRANTLNIDSAAADVETNGDRIALHKLDVTRGESHVDLQATYRLPQTGKDFLHTAIDAQFAVHAPDLKSFGLGANGQMLEGHIEGSGKIQSANDTPAGAIQIDGGDFAYGSFKAKSFTATVNLADDQVKVDKLELQLDADNHLDLGGTYRLPKPGENILNSAMDVDLDVHVPNLETFALGAKGAVLKGHLEAAGKIQSVNNTPTGGLQIHGGEFTFGQFKAKSLEGAINLANQEADIEKLELQIDGNNQISLAGKAGLQGKHEYEGAVLVLLKNLGAFRPLLQTFGISEELAGSVDFTLESKGNLQPQQHLGDVKLAIDKAKYGKINLQEVKLAAAFGSDFAETSQLRVVSGATSFEGALEWRESRLRLRDINLRQGAQQVLSGYLTIPFEPGTSELVPLDKRIAANLNLSQLDLEKLFASLGQTAPVAGNITANLLSGGTILEPSANLKLSAKGLKSKAAAKLDPAQIDLLAHYSEKELTLDATAQQKNLQPLTIKGRAPLDLDAALRQKKLDPDLPIDLTVKLPSTSLAILPGLVPAIRSIAGAASLDAHIGGTVGKPQLGGSANIKVDYARLTSEGAPAIGALQGNLAFTQDSLQVQRFHGEVGGGSFDLSGKVQFTKITEPVFDLHLKSNSVLVMRNDSMTVRVDTDIAATGPLAAAKLGGTVWVTQSRFFREIDILPIALPGRPKPEPRSAPSQGSFALGPPMSNWTFDIAIKTRPNDPFQVRGNLANGSVSLDLKFGGTGAQPWLDGTVHIDNFVASLPFSKLNITRGFVTFSKDAPFEPKLDLLAESTLRDYHINAYIYGGAKNPQLSLTSEPPLTQEDILSLLATGATSSELTGSSDVLASRAAVLLFQQLYRKVFKQKDPTEGLPLADRLSVDVGAVDSKTGREEVSASFKLGSQFYLVGDVDVTGSFAGRVKYLIKFK